MKKVQAFEISINNVPIPAKLYQESRNSVRFSIGKKHAIIRMPYFLSPNEKRKHLDRFEEWLTKVLEENKGLLRRLSPRAYQTGDILRVKGKNYKINVVHEDRKSHSAQLKEDTITIKISNLVSTLEATEATKKLISRVVAKEFSPQITKRVHELNQLHFNQPVQNIRLKYNHSNWGSCSGKGNINLSTRLLFAPDEVIDYVIIHELAHRIEMNHSSRFWALVSNAMPNYEQHETWLKTHGRECDF